MPDKNIFCSAPWYELQIYWDGSLGFCCQEAHRLYPQEQTSLYNVANMTIREWMDSEPVRAIRLAMFEDEPLSVCTRCYHEEQFKGSSKRLRSNQKAVIFTKTAFQHSYTQSPAWEKFEHSRLNHGAADTVPIDLHIDLGNYCNLACKMCSPKASSKIAAQYQQWNISGTNSTSYQDWTRDEQVWEKVLEELASIANLRNIHFMGGETLITARFEQFVDFMLSRNRRDLHFSFVTNGTVFKEALIEKLKQFRRVGIEVSIESLDHTNAYQRQGTDQATVMLNIQKYLAHCNDSTITLTIRPAISLLTIGSYCGLLEYCLENRFVVKSLLVYSPTYLDPRLLPDDVKKIYIARYHDLEQRYDLDKENTEVDFNEGDANQFRRIVKAQIDQCIQLLSSPQPADAESRWQEMTQWCQRWDLVYGYDARSVYPELRDVLEKHGYRT